MSGAGRNDPVRSLISAAMIEGACILVGVAGFLGTGNWVWLVGGILMGLGFSLPALITYLRTKDQTDA
ncbi:MAG: hypothetical protein AAFQ21_03590 [Pseudomonadota bacterium]